MICNGINFNDEWVKSFKTAEEFIQHPKQHRLVSIGLVSNEALTSFFELCQTLNNGNLNQNVSGAVSETQPQSSDSGNSESQTGSDSGPAGNTNEQRGKGRRQQAS